MREIKFRAWDKKEKHMCEEVVYIDFKGRMIGIHHIGYGTYGTNLNQVKLMQYTGLKDKDGKEIYEGDIIEERYAHPLTEETIVKKFSVKYMKDCFIGELIGNSPFGDTWLSFINEGKVVGNIYENKIQ